jgi:hypothetical protein
MAVNFSQFAASTTPANADQIVGYSNTSPGGERRWAFSDISNTIKNSVITSINTTITSTLSSPTGSFRIKKFADSIINQSYVGAAVTVDEEAIIWGNLDTYQIGHLWYTTDVSPKEAISIPFLDGADGSKLDDRRRVVDIKKEGKTIVRFYHTGLQSMALLSDGTVWVKAYIHATATLNAGYGTGFSTGEINGCTTRYSSVFYRVTQWTWTNPARANKIVDIQLLPTNGVDTDATYCALDDAGDLHLWGHMNPQYSTSVRWLTPRNTTNGTSLQGIVKDFQVMGFNGQRSLHAITTTGQVWSLGYNAYGQLCDNSVTARTGWVRGQAAATPTSTTLSPVANASKLVRCRNYSYLNTGYISTVSGTQNQLFVGGWENDTYSPKSVATTSKAYVAATGGTSPANDPIDEAFINGRNDYPGMFYKTAAGRVFSAGTSSWGDLGRTGHPGPSFGEVDVIHPVTGAKVKFGPASGLIAKAIILGEGWNANANAIIAVNSAVDPNFNYVFITGYRSMTNIDDFAQSNLIFTPLSIKESVEDVQFGISRDNHEYTYVLCKNGRMYGFGHSASGSIKGVNGWISLPVPIF